MTIFDSIVLGGVQGITEFIPVSSSGHLIMAERFLGLESFFTFGVLLNIGTLVALVVFFNQRIINAFREVFLQRNYRFGLILTLSIAPTFLVGFLFSAFFENISENLWVIVAALVGIGILMIKFGQPKTISIMVESDSRVSDGLVIGITQTLALIPGVSRSGVTILTAVNRGFSVKSAANFSFLMAAPTILGAVIHSLLFKDGLAFIRDNSAIFWLGNLASLILGLLAVKVMLGLLNKYGLEVFGWYRLGLGALIATLLITNVL